MTLNPEQLKSATGVVLAIAETIRELKTVPSGTLYAHLCGKFTLGQYESVIGILERAGVIRCENHLLVWIGGVPK